METWHQIPRQPLIKLAEKEQYARRHYRPVYAMSRGFATRPGSLVRGIAIAALADEATTKGDILRYEDSRAVGRFYEDQSQLALDRTVLDPFVGGGTIPAECNRLGAKTVGYELNPTLWFNVKKIFDPLNTKSLREISESLLEKIRARTAVLYQTSAPEFEEPVTVIRYYRQRVESCLTCGDEVRLCKDRFLKRDHSGHSTVICPNRECPDRIIKSETDDTQDTLLCPACETKFDPAEGTSRFGKYVCEHGHESALREAAIKSNTQPEYELVAIEYGDSRQLKSPSEWDTAKESEVEQRYLEAGQSLAVPNQELPESDIYDQLRENNITHYDELFTPRQKLVFGRFIESIGTIEDQNIAEYLLLALAYGLEFNTAYTPWLKQGGRPTSLIRTNKPTVPHSVVESNPFRDGRNIEIGIEQIIKAKQFCTTPSERRLVDGSVEKEPIPDEIIGEPPSINLSASSATRLDERRETADLIFTDPPYFDTVQYGPLTDFYRTWYKLLLSERYSAFAPKWFPDTKEIIVDRSRGKDQAMYQQALVNAFAEMHRVLTDDGELIFFQHILGDESLSIIFEILFEAGFAVNALFPIYVMDDSNQSIEADVLIFADKSEDADEISLQTLRQDLYVEISEITEEELSYHPELTPKELKCVLLGRSLSAYSRHYPNVIHNDQLVSPETMVDIARSIIDDHLSSKH